MVAETHSDIRVCQGRADEVDVLALFLYENGYGRLQLPR